MIITKMITNIDTRTTMSFLVQSLSIESSSPSSLSISVGVCVCVNLKV